MQEGAIASFEPNQANLKRKQSDFPFPAATICPLELDEKGDVVERRGNNIAGLQHPLSLFCQIQTNRLTKRSRKQLRKLHCTGK